MYCTYMLHTVIVQWPCVYLKGTVAKYYKLEMELHYATVPLCIALPLAYTHLNLLYIIISSCHLSINY